MKEEKKNEFEPFMNGVVANQMEMKKITKTKRRKNVKAVSFICRMSC